MRGGKHSKAASTRSATTSESKPNNSKRVLLKKAPSSLSALVNSPKPSPTITTTTLDNYNHVINHSMADQPITVARDFDIILQGHTDHNHAYNSHSSQYCNSAGCTANYYQTQPYCCSQPYFNRYPQMASNYSNLTISVDESSDPNESQPSPRSINGKNHPKPASNEAPENPKGPNSSSSSSSSSPSTSKTASSTPTPSTSTVSPRAYLDSRPSGSGFQGAHTDHHMISSKMPPPPPPPPLPPSLPPPPPPPVPSFNSGAKNLSKLKRFLTTLQQFAADISPETGERVKSLILNLVNSGISIEEFHSKLQEYTNFPLRPFVIPFLKSNLPLLQYELFYLSRSAKLSSSEYFVQNSENILANDSLFNAEQPPAPTTNANNHTTNKTSHQQESSSAPYGHHSHHNPENSTNPAPNRLKRKTPESQAASSSATAAANVYTDQPPLKKSILTTQANTTTASSQLHPYPRSYPSSTTHHNHNRHHHQTHLPVPFSHHHPHSHLSPITPPANITANNTSSNPTTSPSSSIPSIYNPLNYYHYNPLTLNHHTPNRNSPSSFFTPPNPIHLFPYSAPSTASFSQQSIKRFEDKEKSFINYMRDFEHDFQEFAEDDMDTDLKSIDYMLSSVSEMIEQAKRIVSILQSKASKLRQQKESYFRSSARSNDEDVRKNNDSIIEGIKRQAYIEMQRGINAAERKASEMLRRERERIDKILKEAQKVSADERNTKRDNNKKNERPREEPVDVDEPSDNAEIKTEQDQL